MTRQTNQQLVEVSIPDLLDQTGVEFVQGWATGIDPTARTVQLTTADGGRTLKYDTLVYAIGSVADTSR